MHSVYPSRGVTEGQVVEWRHGRNSPGRVPLEVIPFDSPQSSPGG